MWNFYAIGYEYGKMLTFLAKCDFSLSFFLGGYFFLILVEATPELQVGIQYCQVKTNQVTWKTIHVTLLMDKSYLEVDKVIRLKLGRICS